MTLVHVVHDQYGLMTLLRTVPLYTRDSPPFGFKTEKVARMKGEMSSRNLKKSSCFLPKRLYYHDLDD